jgi:hypothetical protein
VVQQCQMPAAAQRQRRRGHGACNQGPEDCAARQQQPRQPSPPPSPSRSTLTAPTWPFKGAPTRPPRVAARSTGRVLAWTARWRLTLTLRRHT